MQLAAINIFPIKSCAAVGLDEAAVRPRGLVADRRWLVSAGDGTALTGRDHTLLPLMRVDVEADGIRLFRQGVDECYVPAPGPGGRRNSIRVWSDQVNALDAGDEAAQWLSRMLGETVRLNFMDAAAKRPMVDSGAEVSFADVYPLLLTNTASLEAVSARAGELLDMQRFRPNIVVSSDSAFAEDTWRELRIGDVQFEVAGPCERCEFTTLDPQTAESHPRQEPLRTLGRFRRDVSGGVCFGANLVPRSEGIIRKGDRIEVLQTGEPRPVLRPERV